MTEEAFFVNDQVTHSLTTNCSVGAVWPSTPIYFLILNQSDVIGWLGVKVLE